MSNFNMVLQNIDVRHPCQAESNAPKESLTAVEPFNRAAEEQKMGNFVLEEALESVLAVLGEDCSYNLDELQEFNESM